jgi:CRISPR/Cas system-associated exonuclease Cas4 (RecB family)
MPERRRGAPRSLSASDVGRYAYCARAWWLERVGGVTPSNRAALEAGERLHHAHGRLVSAAQRQGRFAQLLLWLAAALAVALAASLLWP